MSEERHRVWDPGDVDGREHRGVTVRSRTGVPIRDPDDLSATRWSFDESDDDIRRPQLGGMLRTFVRRYGWRAYALPVLVVVTVLALMSMVKPAGKTSPPQSRATVSFQASQPAQQPTPPGGSSSAQIKTDQPGQNAQNQALSSDALPPGPNYTKSGSGTFEVVPGTGPVVGNGTLHTYTIEVENGITGVDVKAFVRKVDQALDDQRSWTKMGTQVALQRVASGSVDFRVTLTSSMTVRSLCGYDQQIETSCFAPNDDSRVVLNVARWVRGDVAYIGDLDAYHIYMVNHEVGHALGHMHSHVCLSNGLAPVMMQQTIGLRAQNGKICEANPWPYPPGVKDAPGAESEDTPQNSPLIPD